MANQLGIASFPRDSLIRSSFVDLLSAAFVFVTIPEVACSCSLFLSMPSALVLLNLLKRSRLGIGVWKLLGLVGVGRSVKLLDLSFPSAPRKLLRPIPPASRSESSRKTLEERLSAESRSESADMDRLLVRRVFTPSGVLEAAMREREWERDRSFSLLWSKMSCLAFQVSSRVTEGGGLGLALTILDFKASKSSLKSGGLSISMSTVTKVFGRRAARTFCTLLLAMSSNWESEVFSGVPDRKFSLSFTI